MRSEASGSAMATYRKRGVRRARPGWSNPSRKRQICHKHVAVLGGIHGFALAARSWGVWGTPGTPGAQRGSLTRAIFPISAFLSTYREPPST